MGLEERGLVAFGAEGLLVLFLLFAFLGVVGVGGGGKFRVVSPRLVAFRRGEEERPADLGEAREDAGELPVDDAHDDGGIVG